MSLSDALTTLCARARDLAGVHGEPVVASWVRPVAPGDPLNELARRPAGGFRFAWARPKAGFALAAGGVAREFRAQGPRRFADLAERVGTALKLALTHSENGGPALAGVPYALGGFAFFDRPLGESWPGFDPAHLVIPAWMVLRRGERQHLVCSTAVDAADDPAERAGTLSRLADEALAAAAPRGADTGAPGVGVPRRFARGDEVAAHSRWRDMVSRAVARVRAGGSLAKVVLARAVDLSDQRPLSVAPALERLQEAYPDCFTFLVDPGHGSAFLGATPERLARLEGGVLQLGALAGSAPRGERPDADAALGRALLESPKEREEHAVVVRAIREAAAPFGTVEAPETPRLVKLTNVQHLYTPITLRPAAPISLLALLERLHPTPAVGGHPREVALELIRAEEGFERGWYAGPVGWLNAAGEGEFGVALRSGLVRGGQVRLFTGAGIVADSDPETEYFETQLKLQPMLTALAQS